MKERREAASDVQTEAAPPKEIFALLHASFVKHREGLIQGGYKVVGFLLVVLGWLLTSASARTLFTDSPGAKLIASFALLLGVPFYAWDARRTMAISQELYVKLQELAYVKSDRYSDRLIDGKMVRHWVGAVSFLVLLEITLIWLVL